MRRTTAVLAGLLLSMSAACASDESATRAEGRVGAGVSTSTTTDGADATDTESPTTPAPTTSVTGPRPAPPTTRATSPSTTGPTTADSPAPAPTPTTAPAADPGQPDAGTSDDGSKGPPGAFARTLLRPQPATTLVLERAVQEGADLAASTLTRNARVMGEVAGKPVDVRPPIALAGGAQSWSADQLRAAADRMARTPQGDAKAVLRLLVVRGTLNGDRRVLGAAIRGDVIVLFRDAIDATSTPVVSARVLEDAVLLHEIGHVLGLVDIVLDTGREDPERPGHSKNRDSVMYWAVESDLIVQVLGGPPPNTFDDADLADLRALRGGA